MNAPFVVAQAVTSGSAKITGTIRTIKLEKPAGEQAVAIHMDGNTKLDLTGVASEKLQFVRVGERLVILFDNSSTITIEPFFDSSGKALQLGGIELGANRLMTGEDLVSMFPVTDDRSVLPLRTVHLVKPQGEQALVIPMDGKIKLDFTAIANEKITLVHVGERLVILFDNKSTITIDPFFDSSGKALQLGGIELGTNRLMTGEDLVALFPVTEDQSVLPAAGEQGTPLNTGGPFAGPNVDPINGLNPLDLLPPEQLGTWVTEQQTLLPLEEVETTAAPTDGTPTADDSEPSANPDGDIIDDEGQNFGLAGAVDAAGDAPGIPTFVSGLLNFSYGPDGQGDLVFDLATFGVVDENSGAVSPLQARILNGDGVWETLDVDVTISLDGRTLTGRTVPDSTLAGVVHDVFTLKITDITTGAFEFQASAALVHPLQDDGTGSTEYEDDLILAVNFVVTDGNGTQATAVLRITVDDDTPDLDVTVNDDSEIGSDTGYAFLPLDLDETVGPDNDPAQSGDDRYSSADFVADNDGDYDDVETATPQVYNRDADPAGANPIGRVETATGAGGADGDLYLLFNVNPQPGADGPKSLDHLFDLVLTGFQPGDGVETTLQVTQPVESGNPDADGGADLDPYTPYADPTIYLFVEPDGSITGRVGNDPSGFIALRIRLENPTDPSLAKLVFEQFMAIEHTDGNAFDSTAYLTLAEQGASLAVTLASTLVDGDDDAVTDPATAILADDSGFTVFRIDDDGPLVDVDAGTGVAATALALNLDESIDPAGDGFNPDPLAGEDLGNTGEITDLNGDLDDIAGVTAVTGTGPIGTLTTAAGAVKSLFGIPVFDAGTDGQKSASYDTELVLSAAGLETKLSVTQPALGGNPDSDNVGGDYTPYANPRIYLYQLDANTIVGRVGTVDGGLSPVADPAGDIALRIVLNEGAADTLDDDTITVEQWLAIDHDAGQRIPDSPSLFDEERLLQLVSGSLDLKLTVTLTDGDDDVASDDYTVTLVDDSNTPFAFDDDGPNAFTLTAGTGVAATALALNLDESIDSAGDGFNPNPVAGEDRYQGAETESGGGSANGDLDDIAGVTAVTGTGPIGTLTTAAGAVKSLFGIPVFDAGTDGQKSVSYDTELVLSAAGLATTLGVTQPAPGGNPDSDNAGGDYTPYANRQIYLFLEAGVIVGRVGTVDVGLNPVADPAGDIALRIVLNEGAANTLDDDTITGEQWLAINHDAIAWPNAFDTQLMLRLLSGSLDLKLTATLTDGDNDVTSDDHTVRLIDGVTSPFGFDDDGPAAPSLSIGASVTHDETVGVQSATPINNDPANNGDGNDVAGSTAITFNGLPSTVASLFAGITTANGATPGDDPHVAGSDPLGYAAGTGAIVNTTGGGFGTDGGSKTYALKLASNAGVFSGARTTEGRDVFLYSALLGGIALILGRVADEANAAPGLDTPNPTGDVAFALAIDPDTGVVYVVQYLSLEHPNQATAGNGYDSYDERVSLLPGALQVEVTYSDGDGDKASVSLDISGQFNFEDDGHIAVGDLDTIGLSGIINTFDDFETLNDNAYNQVGAFNINNSFGGTDGAKAAEASSNGATLANLSTWFGAGGTSLADIVGSFQLSTGVAASLTNATGGSGFESVSKVLTAGSTLSFDWAFRTNEPTAGFDNDYAFWSLYKVTGGTIAADGTVDLGATYQFIDAGLIFDVNALYSNNLDGAGGYLRVDSDGDGAVDHPAETFGGSPTTGWEFGIPYSPTGLAWVNTFADVKTDQSKDIADDPSFLEHGDVDPGDGQYLISAPSDGTYVLRFGIIDIKAGSGGSEPSELNIDRIRTQTVIDYVSTGNVLAGTTDEGSSGGVDAASVDGSRVAVIAYDRDLDGVIEDGAAPDEVLEITVGGSQPFTARFGTFTIESDGDYTYAGSPTTSTQLEAAFPGATVYDEVVQYTAVDGDGDTSAALLTVRIDAFGGDRGNDDFYIGSLFDDTFAAGDGNDILRGRGGNDTLDGGAGIDLLDFSDASAGITFALSQGAGPHTTGPQPGLGTDTYSNMEGVIGSAFADTITGSALADVLLGGGGADTLFGGTGDDDFKFNAPTEGMDGILDFALGDEIVIDDTGFGLGITGTLTGPNGNLYDEGVNIAGASANSRFFFDTSPGDATLYFDTDAGAGRNWVALAQLQNGYNLDNSEIKIVA